MTKQQPNPYKAPQVEKTSAERPGEYYVDMPYLVVRNGAQLPPRCVITNRPSTDCREKKLQYPNKWNQFSVLNHGCTVRWFVAEYIHKQQQRRVFGSSLVVVTFAILIFMPNAFSLVPLAGIVMLLLVFLCAVGAIYYRMTGIASPRVVKHRGGMFWVEGLGHEFLTSLQEEQRSD